jgi:trimeric autotransporter adhesin
MTRTIRESVCALVVRFCARNRAALISAFVIFCGVMAQSNIALAALTCPGAALEALSGVAASTVIISADAKYKSCSYDGRAPTDGVTISATTVTATAPVVMTVTTLIVAHYIGSVRIAHQTSQTGGFSYSYLDGNGKTVTLNVGMTNSQYLSSFTIFGGEFDDLTAPRLTVVAPATGTTFGGTTVTLTGENLTGVTAVRFGSAPAQSMTAVNATQIMAVTPAYTSGQADVEVTTPFGSARKSQAFNYVMPPQAPLVLAATSISVPIGQTSTLSTTGGTGGGAVTFAQNFVLNAGSCGVTGNTLTAFGAGVCTVTASKDGGGIYQTATAAPLSITVVPIAQAAFTAAVFPSTVGIGGTAEISSAGGSGTGGIFYEIVLGGSATCSISGTVLTATSIGTCTVRATKYPDRNYLQTSADVIVTVTGGTTPQSTLSASVAATSISVNSTTMLGVSGGSGTGAISYAVTSGAAYCSVSGTTLTGIGGGTCTVTAVKAGDATYASARATVVVTVGQAQAALVFPTSTMSVAFNSGFQLGVAGGVNVAGGSGTGAITYAVVSGASSCSVINAVPSSLSTSGGVGTCTLVATKAGDGIYSPTTAALVVTVVQAKQRPLTAAATPAAIPVGGTSSLSRSGGTGGGATLFAVTNGSTFCSVSGSTLTGLAVGSCTVTATKDGGANYLPESGQVIVQVGGVTPQAALTMAASPTAIAFNGVSILSTSGGSGTGAVSYAVATGGALCSISGTALTGTGVGTCTITATKAADATYAATTATATITVSKAAQTALVASASPTNVTVNAISALSTSGGSGTGAISYAVTTGANFCSVSGATMTGVSAGACSITATKAADANFSATSAQVNVSVLSAVQTPQAALNVIAPAFVEMFANVTISQYGGSGTGAISYAITVGGTSCSINGSTLTGMGLGACTVTVTKAADATYAATSATATVTVVKAKQAVLIATATPNVIAVNGTSTLNASGGSGTGTISYNIVTGSTFCSLNGAVITGIGVGSCTVDAIKAGDANYAATTGMVTITVGKLPQAPLTVAASPTIIKVNGTSAISSTGGSGVGAVNYNVTAGPCGVSGVNATGGTTLGGVSPGTCTVTVFKNGDATYAPSTASTTVTVEMVPQPALTAIASPNMIAINGTSSLSATGGAGIGTISYAVTAGATFCSVNGAVLTGTSAGTCTVTATKAADTYFSAATTQFNVTVSAGPRPQAAMTMTASPSLVAFNATTALGITGGSGSGLVSYAVTAGATVCSVNGAILTGIGVGSCTVTATKAADATYAAAAASTTVTVGKAAQANLAIAASPSTLAVGARSSLSANGGSGNGTISYAVTVGGTFCSVSGTTLTATGAGVCTVTATKAADTNYNAATATATVSVDKAVQATFVATAAPSAIVVNAQSALAATGGSGGGIISYAITSGSGNCALTGISLKGTGVGICVVTATKAADANYLAATAQVSVTVGAGTQSISFTKPTDATFSPGGSIALRATATSGLPVTFATTTPAVCSVSGASVTMLSSGTCAVIASQLGNSTVAAAPSVTQTFTINGVATSINLVVSGSVGPTGQAMTLTASVSPVSAIGTVNFKDGTTTICGNVPVANGAASCGFVATGNHALTATFTGQGSFASATSTAVTLGGTAPNKPDAAATAGKFMAQRQNLIASNQFSGDRQVDRLVEAGNHTSGKHALTAGANISGSVGIEPSRLGAGSDFGAGRLGSRLRGSLSDELGLRQGTFDEQEPTGAVGKGMPVNVSGSTDGSSRVAFSTSLSQILRLNSDSDAAKGRGGRAAYMPLDVWLEGKYGGFRTDRSTINNTGYFGSVSMGADYVLNRSFLLGAFVQFDQMQQSTDVQQAKISGAGWLAGPYATLKLSENIFWQARAGWGRSNNELSQTPAATDKFSSERRLASTTVSGRWAHESWLVQPAISVSYLEETAKGYTDVLGASVPAMNSHLGQAKAGPVISFRHEAKPDLIIEPRLGLEVVWDFASGGTVPGLNHASTDKGLRGRSELGVRFGTPGGAGLDLSGSYDGIGSNNFSAVTGRAAARVPLN